MIPLLAPLLGSLAGSLLPASVGTGIAGALGLKGAAAGLVAGAAPKAIGAGIGTLLAGGDLGEAALNAVGFGAGSAITSQLLGAGVSNAGAAVARPAAAAAATTPAPVPVAPPPVVPTAATESAMDVSGLARSAQQIAQALGGGQQSQPNMSMAPVNRPPQQRASDNPMLAPMFNAAPMTQGPMSTPTVPISTGASMMPASVGIGSLQPMNNMFAGMSPDQSSMVNDYLRSRNMVGFV